MTRTTLAITTGLLIVAAVGCFFVGGWFDSRKYTLSGVPTNHYAVNESGRTYYVPRGGPSLNQRTQVPFTAEQYRLWEENERSASLWAGIAALFFLAAWGPAVWLSFARRKAAMVRLTRLYIAGVLVGFGLSLVVGTLLSWGWHPGIVIPGFLLIAVGAILAGARRGMGGRSEPPNPFMAPTMKP